MADADCRVCHGTGRILTDIPNPDRIHEAPCPRCVPQSIDPPWWLVAHSFGMETSLHALGSPCATCRPPITITEEMVERGCKAQFEAAPRPDNESWEEALAPARLRSMDWANHQRNRMRLALEAALNG